MGRPGISVADVVVACIALNRQGRSIGPTNIRLELGRGSFRTISTHLKLLALRTARTRVRAPGKLAQLT